MSETNVITKPCPEQKIQMALHVLFDQLDNEYVAEFLDAIISLPGSVKVLEQLRDGKPRFISEFGMPEVTAVRHLRFLRTLGFINDFWDYSDYKRKSLITKTGSKVVEVMR